MRYFTQIVLQAIKQMYVLYCNIVELSVVLYNQHYDVILPGMSLYIEW